MPDNSAHLDDCVFADLGHHIAFGSLWPAMIVFVNGAVVVVGLATNFLGRM